MIRINEITRGRFGNRVLQYNSLMQLASIIGTNASCSDWEGRTIFKDVVYDTPSQKEQKFFNWDVILNSKFENLSNNYDYYIDDPAYLLHNTFNQITRKNPREFLSIKKNLRPILDINKTNVGIHIRGDDIISADGNNGREVHSPQYYKNAIDFVESKLDNTVYHVCTDDLTFETYTQTLHYLKENNHQFVLGDINNLVFDFATLSECDVLISSSSTFVITAGFLGKSNKKIIHSMSWIEKHFDETYVPWGNYTIDYPESYWKSYDNFWIELYNGGNQFYKAWRFV